MSTQDIATRLRSFADDSEPQMFGFEYKLLHEAAGQIDRLRAALKPFAEPHTFGDAYVKFSPKLIEAARAALDPQPEVRNPNGLTLGQLIEGGFKQ